MTFLLPKLPWSEKALSHVLSQETIQYHYGKHHAAYVAKLNELVKGTNWEKKSLEEIIRQADGALFNQAAQVWNHTFYWNSLSPTGGREPFGDIATRIEKDFGSFSQFKDLFTNTCLKHFGSGWVWLYEDKACKQLKVMSTSDANTPLRNPMTVPLLTCDVWEHAYYIDYRNARAKYIEGWWDIVNWNFANENLEKIKNTS